MPSHVHVDTSWQCPTGPSHLLDILLNAFGCADVIHPASQRPPVFRLCRLSQLGGDQVPLWGLLHLELGSTTGRRQSSTNRERVEIVDHSTVQSSASAASLSWPGIRCRCGGRFILNSDLREGVAVHHQHREGRDSPSQLGRGQVLLWEPLHLEVGSKTAHHQHRERRYSLPQRGSCVLSPDWRSRFVLKVDLRGKQGKLTAGEDARHHLTLDLWETTGRCFLPHLDRIEGMDGKLIPLGIRPQGGNGRSPRVVARGLH